MNIWLDSWKWISLLSSPYPRSDGSEILLANDLNLCCSLNNINLEIGYFPPFFADMIFTMKNIQFLLAFTFPRNRNSGAETAKVCAISISRCFCWEPFPIPWSMVDTAFLVRRSLLKRRETFFRFFRTAKNARQIVLATSFRLSRGQKTFSLHFRFCENGKLKRNKAQKYPIFHGQCDTRGDILEFWVQASSPGPVW